MNIEFTHIFHFLLYLLQSLLLSPFVFIQNISKCRSGNNSFQKDRIEREFENVLFLNPSIASGKRNLIPNVAAEYLLTPNTVLW